MRAVEICSPVSVIAAVTSCSRPGRSRPLISIKECVFDALLSISTRGGTRNTRVRLGSISFCARINSWARRRRPSIDFSIRVRSFFSLSLEANAAPLVFCTQKVSSAIPLARVRILASTIDAPVSAMAPAMAANRPG